MWYVVTILLLSAQQSLGWVSGGDRSDSTVLANNKLNLVRKTDWLPLRITFDTSGSFSGAGGVSMASYPDINKMTKSVSTYFLNSLTINRVDQEITTESINCGNGINLAAGIYGGSDVVIVVRGYNGGASGETGFSQVCHLQQGGSENVVAGIISINIDAFNAEPDYLRKWTFIAHLTVHVLGFSEALYPYWGTSLGKVGVSHIITDITVRGLTKKAIVAPKARDTARAVYAYSTLVGIELEEPTTFSSRNEHWDSRILFNDVSCGRSYNEMIISSVTLALLEDSGWYKVSGCGGQPPIFGRGLGCSFIEQKCINSAGNSIFQNLWCSKSKTSSCDAFHLRKGSCTVNTNLIPTISNSAMNYFGNIKTGGSDSLADYCPYTIPIDGGNCRSTSSTPVAGQTFGATSRCLEHSINLSGSTDPAALLPFSAGCFDIDCSGSGDYKFIISGSAPVTITCPQAGGMIFVSTLLSGKKVQGWVNCPPRSEICGDVPCTNACNGQGCCVNGVCQCFNGYAGTTCDITCPAFCNVCPGGVCSSCQDGFYLDTATNTCKKCTTGCITCTSANGCTTLIPGYTQNITPDGNVVVKPECSPNCHDCIEPYTCGTPNDGYCLDSTQLGAKACCSGCDICLPNDCCYCTKCKFALMLTTINTCTSECVVNCLVCKNTIECATCKNGYNLTQDGRCVRCPIGCSTCYNSCSSDSCTVNGVEIVTSGCSVQSNCDTKCFDCATPVCTACANGYIMNSNNLCDKICPINCQKCTAATNSSPSVCTSCNSGFYLDTSVNPPVCIPCEADCIKCTKVSDTATNCLSCKAGFFIRAQTTGTVTENDCVDCETGCSYCKNELSCGSCVIRFYLNTNDNHCYRCEYGCRTCDKDGCNVADPGFYLEGDGHVIRCHKSCATCDSDLICNTCLPGFFFYECSSSNCLCRDCEPSCAKCSSPTECIVCRSWYFLDVGNKCTICDPLCASCEKAGKCLSCKWGYYLKPDMTCGQCRTGCQNCVDYDHCKICFGGYWPNEYVCDLCPTNCLLCWTPSDCYSCRLGWWLDKASFTVPTCVKCDPLCIRCTSLTDCQVCKRQYYVSNGICQKCGPNCAFCHSNSECTICELGFFLDVDNTCKPCQNGCIDCCDAITCMRARSSWWLDYFPGMYTNRNAGTAIGPYIIPSDLGGYVATPCGYKCLNCLKLDDCGTCQKTSYLNDAKTACIDCIAPCLECASATRCFKCAARYYLNSNAACVYCGDNCNACTETMCTQPKSGYYMVQAVQTAVAPCLAPCNTCVGTGTNDCITCRAGSGIVPETATVYSSTITTYQCDACDTGCRTCNPRNVCLVANNPYYVNPDGTVSKCPDTCTACKITDGIVLCTSCIAKYGLDNGNCVACSDPNCYKCGPRDTCQICYGGWYLNSGFTCSRCVLPCSQCSDESTCKTCTVGYYLPNPSVPGPCSLCMANCNKCTDSLTCDVCKNGFYYDSDSKTCKNCPNLCTACSQITDGSGLPVVKCSACVSKSTIDGNLCVPCGDSNCLTCSPSTACSKCINGYYVDGVSCTKCVAPCGLCTAPTFCTTCIGATYLLSADLGACASCITDCVKCTNGVSCVTCKYAYYYDSILQACKPCPSLCTACYQDSNTLQPVCTTCAAKGTLEGTLCVPCTDLNCLTCSPKSTCSKCINGYYLDGVGCTKCVAPCGLCTSPSFCTSCVGATYLQSAATGSCASCMANCNRCLDGVTCVTCKYAYYYDANQQLCKNCPNLCTACYQDSNTLLPVCTACAAKSALEGTVCVACTDAYCLTCSPSNTCSKCANGYYLDGIKCTKCVAPCGLCTGFNFCTTCVGATYLSSAATGTCTNCVANCLRCLDNTSCVTCKSGYYFDLTLNYCNICPNLCTACNQDPVTLEVKCTACAAKSALEGIICVPCSNAYCLACSPSTVCSKCANGYFLDGVTCTKCIAPCGFCTSATFCTTCVGATYMSSAATGTCSNCLLNCNKCTTGDSCSSIKSGYYMSSPLSNPVINKCPDACSACSETVSGDPSSVVCSACRNTNYILDNGKCCIGSCKICDNSLTCAECIIGASLSSAKLCIKCSLNCASCTSTTQCKTCVTGYYVYSGLCCPNGCLTCNELVCWTCKPNFYLENGACITCPSGCTSCLNGVCQKCNSGYYMSGTNCKSCSFSSCATCESATYCNSCINGFSPTDDGRCVIGYGDCPATCKECNPFRCFTCKTGYYFSYDSCIDCPTGCASCDLDVCQSCKSGYYLSFTTCRQCPAECKSCNSVLNCIDCADGYEISEYGNCVSKTKCGLGCKTCNADNTCAVCAAGYFKTNVGCFACAKGCKDCTGLWACNACSDGYNYLGGNCCPVGCSVCNPGPASCYNCDDDYYLVNGVCTPCRVGCSGCHNGVCNGCLEGYFMTGTLCRKCPVGCKTCWSEFGCDDNCLSGYTYSGTMCVPSP